MGGARALIASLGASISLMAGAALSLLVVSFVFAYGGIPDGISAQAPPAALALAGSPTTTPAGASRPRSEPAPVVIRATPAAAPRPAKRSSARQPARKAAPAPTQPSFNPGVRSLEPPASTPATGKPSGHAPATGDGVREVGDAVSATVQSTGKSAGNAATQLLGPPVSKAVQQVLDLLTSVLQGATGGLGGALDGAVPTR